MNNPPIRFPSISKLWCRRNSDLEEKYGRDVFLQRFMFKSCIIEFIVILVLLYDYMNSGWMMVRIILYFTYVLFCKSSFIVLSLKHIEVIDKFILDNLNLKAVSYFPYTMMCLNNPYRSYYKVVQALNRYCIEIETCRQTNTVSGLLSHETRKELNMFRLGIMIKQHNSSSL